jgi:hypothetical protein
MPILTSQGLGGLMRKNRRYGEKNQLKNDEKYKIVTINTTGWQDKMATM